MTIKHTPGPWAVKDINSQYLIVGNKYGSEKSVLSYSYWIGDFNVPKYEAEANAKLVAAAPELLEALKDLTDYCIHSGHLDMIVEKPQIQKSLSAIKKATE